jgi:hypothetical protein
MFLNPGQLFEENTNALHFMMGLHSDKPIINSKYHKFKMYLMY